MAVVGGEITNGKVRKMCKIRQFRMIPKADGEEGEPEEMLLGEAKVNSVHQGADEKNEVGVGAECGLKISHNGLTFEIGDRIEFFATKK